MTYEYVCTACGHAWEAEQSISAEPLKTCPNCHQEAAKRQISGGAGFILKGGGWYADLYGSSTKKTSSDDKPAATTETKTATDTKGSDKGSSGSSGAGSSGSSGTPTSGTPTSGTPTSGTPSGSKATGAASGA